jgi:urease accessory protein
MRRVTEVRRAGEWDKAAAIERVVLDSADRYRRRVMLTGERGTRFLVDWPQPVMLKDGDGLMLDDGTIVEVVGQPEPLLELGARTPLQFVRLAWHLGNRHTDVQISGDRLRIRRDHVLADMATGLGATVAAVETPFDPEVGAVHDHHHGHDHGA